MLRPLNGPEGLRLVLSEESPLSLPHTPCHETGGSKRRFWRRLNSNMVGRVSGMPRVLSTWNSITILKSSISSSMVLPESGNAPMHARTAASYTPPLTRLATQQGSPCTTPILVSSKILSSSRIAREGLLAESTTNAECLCKYGLRASAMKGTSCCHESEGSMTRTKGSSSALFLMSTARASRSSMEASSTTSLAMLICKTSKSAVLTCDLRLTAVT
mmetsp:Transcript_80503/g.186924  ORF Transcript_80503/g.186924 Transcript_80503/m.186924 type:complete len:217 (+) Transcript_80503:594-1244(+)